MPDALDPAVKATACALLPLAEMAQLVEMSEAYAYASLFDATQISNPELGFSSSRLGSAVVLRAQKINKTLLVNRVLGLGVVEAVTQEDIESLIAAYAGGSVPFGIELSAFAASEHFLLLLKQNRLRKTFPTQVLYRDGSMPPPRYASWAKATGLRVDAVGPEHVDVLARICGENFNVPEQVQHLLRAGSCSTGWRRWLAFDGDSPIGASLSFLRDDVAWLGWTSVQPSHRGRWVHCGIVAKQLEDAHAAGCSWVTTETAVSTKERPDAAYHNLRNFGFREAYLRPVYVFNPRLVL